MRLDPEFVIQPMGSNVSVMVPVGEAAKRFHGVVKLNKTALFIVEKLKEGATENELVDSLASKYEGDRETFEEAVKMAVGKLREAGALIE